MKEIFFNDRDGQTILSRQEIEGIKLDHITTIGELDEAEQLNINSGLIWLSKQRLDIERLMSPDFFQKLHIQLFGKIWRWAGQYRVTAKNIGIDYWLIPSELQKLCDDCIYWVKHNTYTREEYLARFHHRLVSIHPFPNGNGRFSRIITNKLCEILNWKPASWHYQLSPAERRHKYISALQKADSKKYEELIQFFKE